MAPVLPFLYVRVLIVTVLVFLMVFILVFKSRATRLYRLLCRSVRTFTFFSLKATIEWIQVKKGLEYVKKVIKMTKTTKMT